ncbi:hypothetical protein [Pseudomonas sp.]|uniref:hypothetical protein n=1 Tax=Pseudomonas sp. TaxID=306 RepID=UPI0025864731|nr:hypothetical protein [Pseudomonas sp.]
MPDIDWNSCPTATHYLPELNGELEDSFWCAVFWRLQYGVGVEAWQVNKELGKLIHYPHPTWMVENVERLIKRPTTDEERRIAACLKACEGISTEVLELNATAGGVATLERQRNEALAALNTLILFCKPSKTNAVALSHAIRVAGQYKMKAAEPIEGGCSMKPIPISAAERIAKDYGYDQVIIIARKVGDAPDPHGEHCTTYGVTKAHCEVAARAGDFLKYKVMGWAKDDAAGGAQ